MVTDEKEISIHSQPLYPADSENAIFQMNEQFAFYDHISIQVISEPVPSAFRVVITFD
ncbi:hypothetical protein HUW51_00770 (plasmid) [Adhaeribacter swui]|uniref:Uncharacterized protein n=1 Tax=Adhaeribacter swui TaxID=2086471 RepID=A0A7G7G2D8_9BACT|nr:hypothetical protein [Adhaeribacter swui]QNF31322.1 hypothetical protein HUW51_00770 [Adhaeribacter swui]